MPETSVLIVGAGPTGLVLALVLAKRRIPFILVDEDAGPGAHSRAMVVHARTLEFYRQLGFADEVIAQGVKVESAHVRRARSGGSSAEGVMTLAFRDIGRELSPYPFPLAYAQDDHERFLVDKLHAEGADVRWMARLTRFTQDAHEVRATLAYADGRAEEVTSAYLCGCDGAHSVVRETLRVGFPGGTYDQLFYVADVRIAGAFRTDLSVCLGDRILALMLPVRSSGMQRLIGLVPPELSDRTDLTFENIRGQDEPLLGVSVTDVNWFATYRVHHRVAERFRVGRAFLLGDAAHIHSPAGGQGMNTGIGDAINLGWKLADILSGRLAASRLDTYEEERIAFARTLVSTTDRAFTPMVASGFEGEVVRRILAPLLFTVATRFEIGRRTFFRTVSQIRIHYPQTALSAGQAGDVRGGDRLPWTGASGADNFLPLRSFDWQLHVYGTPSRALDEAASRLSMPLHTFAWNEAAEAAGFGRDACYLVRPDGHVALASPTQDLDTFENYRRLHGLDFRGSPAAHELAGD
jgi:2-polyprenyl-6-methoxyphenol hydroxylase-like FAD-dependent oxidoreductase